MPQQQLMVSSHWPNAYPILLQALQQSKYDGLSKSLTCNYHGSEEETNVTGGLKIEHIGLIDISP